MRVVLDLTIRITRSAVGVAFEFGPLGNGAFDYGFEPAVASLFQFVHTIAVTEALLVENRSRSDHGTCSNSRIHHPGLIGVGGQDRHLCPAEIAELLKLFPVLMEANNEKVCRRPTKSMRPIRQWWPIDDYIEVAARTWLMRSSLAVH